MSINLNKLDSMLDETLNKETTESLNEWIEAKDSLFTLTAEENKLLQSLLWEDYNNHKRIADSMNRQYGSYASESYYERASLCKGLIRKLENYQYEQEEF